MRTLKPPVTIACVLKGGGDFTPEDAVKLKEMVEGNLTRKHRFICFTDLEVPFEKVPLVYDYPGWWAKMELFRPEIEGDILYFDLDTVISGNIDHFTLLDSLATLREFDYRKGGLASGVMFLPEKDRKRVWDRWISSPEEFMGKFRGDQDFLNMVYGKKVEFFQNLFPASIVSFKFYILKRYRGMKRRRKPEKEIAQKLLDKINVICFHGYPRPKQVKYLEPWINVKKRANFYGGEQMPISIPNEVVDQALFNVNKEEFNDRRLKECPKRI